MRDSRRDFHDLIKGEGNSSILKGQEITPTPIVADFVLQTFGEDLNLFNERGEISDKITS